MITVVHVITQLELGGAQENTLYTCGHLDRTEFRVVLAYGPGGILDGEAKRLPCTTIAPLPHLVRELDPLNDSRCLMDLVKLFRAENRGGHHVIVHTHSSKAGILGRLAARIAKVPHVVHTIHGFGFFSGQHPLKHAFFVEAERAAGRGTDAFICVSKANLAEARARGIIRPHQPVHVIRSGMPLSLYRGLNARRDQARASLSVAADRDVILFIGNFKPQKDPLTLIRAMREVATQRPQATLLMAGDGELRPAVEAEIRRLALESNVRLLGWRDDIPELLAAADVVALSSLFEGLPRSAVQAIAAGRPFVGTRVDGTTEIIRHGKNGFLVEPRSPAKLARALVEALVRRPVDPEDAERILAWDADKMVEAQAELYRALVKQRSEPVARYAAR